MQLSYIIAMTTKKDTRLNIRISDEELDLMKAFASDAKMTLADWVRQKLLGHGDDLGDLRIQVKTLSERLMALEAKLDQSQAV